MINLKRCPYSDKHRVYGGHPVFVCINCGTEWVVVNKNGKKYVLYTHFGSDGDPIRIWRVPLEKELTKV